MFRHTQTLLVLLGLLTAAFAARAGDEDIRLSSIGFLPERSKHVSVTAGDEDEFALFTVRNAADDTAVFEGELSRPQAGREDDIVAQIGDFSPVTTPGIYYVEVTGVGRSRPFPIAADVYDAPFRNAMLGFYGWRSGIDINLTHGGVTFSHTAGHLQDGVIDYVLDGFSGEAGDIRDGVGGWYDAGDYGKYIVNAAFTVGMMMTAWEDFHQTLETIPLPIPETGGALPDYLDEIRYELDWMLKMQLDDGRVSHKLTALSFSDLHTRPAEDTSTRYYSPHTTAATAAFTGAMAQASRVYRPYDEAFADACLSAAERSYAYLQANPDEYPAEGQFSTVFADFKTGSYETSDHDDRLWAAAEIWAVTGSLEALADFEARALEDDDLVVFSFDWSNLQNLGFIAYVRGTPFDGDRDMTLVAALEEDFLNAGRALINNGKASAFGRSLLDFYWGSNGSLARACMVLQTANRLSPDPEYLNACTRQISYLYGRNAYGRSQVTGEGLYPPCHPHDRRSISDDIIRPYPGLLVGGASSPRNWQDQENNYQTNEVANNWNGGLVYALAGFVTGSVASSSVGYEAPVSDCTEVPPDPPKPEGADVSGPPVMIEDFEDGDQNILAEEGRGGAWYTLTDGTAGENSGLLIVDGGATASQKAGFISASGYTWWGGGFGFPFTPGGDAREPYDGSAYNGIRFFAKADQPMDLIVAVLDGNTTEQGGVCSQCNDHFRTSFFIETEWKEYAVSWVELSQMGWGAPQRNSLNPSALYGVQFQWGANVSIGLFLDDIAFATVKEYGQDDTDSGLEPDLDGGALDAGPDSGEAGSFKVASGGCTCNASGYDDQAVGFVAALWTMLFGNCPG